MTSQLDDVLANLDEYGTPKTKLPDCPQCGNDELAAVSSERIICYACGYRHEAYDARA